MLSPASPAQLSTTRPVTLRRRPDLVVGTQWSDGQTWYVLKDPIALRYTRLRREEYRILELLDGRRSLTDLQRIIEDEFKPQRLPLRELQEFLGKLYERGLVLSEARGQGKALLDRSEKEKKRRLFGALANPFYVQLPGFDPERLLRALLPCVRWMFTPFAVAAVFLLMLSALGVIVLDFERFRSQPEMQSVHAFFSPRNLLWMWVALGLVKVLHEFGHGLACAHFGGECHSMGVLFMLFSPGMYCTVTDTWMLPNKWHRIWISAAGIYVELLLASLATWVWWLTAPGLVHSLAFSVMFLCSVNTVLLNGNPLMRFDGYYILSDWLEIPNLSSKANQTLRDTVLRWGVGLDLPAAEHLPRERRLLFLAYAPAAFLYGWMVRLTLLWFLYTFLKPYKLGVIGIGLALFSVTTMLIVPLYRLVSSLVSTMPSRSMNLSRPVLSGILTSTLVAAACFVPIPLRVHTLLTIEPRAAESVFVTVPGRLTEIGTAAGESVHKGDVLAVLENEDLRTDLESLEQQAKSMEIALHTQRALNRPGELQRLRAALAETQRQIEKCREQLDRLVLRAPREGNVLFPPAEFALARLDAEASLGGWERVPLQPANRGSHLEAGTLVCQIGPADALEAVLIVDQADIEFLQRGQPVRLNLDAYAGETLLGTIEEISHRELDETPRQLAQRGGGELATTATAEGRERPLNPSYLVRVRVEDPELSLRPGLRGRARIECGTRTCWQWLRRALTQTFYFSF